MKFLKGLKFFDRLKEPSTHGGVAAMAALFLPQIAHLIPDLLTHGLGLVAAGSAAFAILKADR